MSAYGAIARKRPSTFLAPTQWSTRIPGLYITTFHLTAAQCATPSLSGLVAFMHSEFADEVEAGRTYPQVSDVPDGKLSYEAFMNYFFAEDVIVGIIGHVESDDGIKDGNELDVDIESVRGNREWRECVGGFYYVKPNYPGRSSHNCNGGFVSTRNQRGKGIASALGRSYLHYAPRLGYEASVFNLVYVNNIASVRIWEKLNFTKVGIVPRAGRLKTEDGKGEEYVDAWVFYKKFDTIEG